MFSCSRQIGVSYPPSKAEAGANNIGALSAGATTSIMIAEGEAQHLSQRIEICTQPCC